CSTNQLSGTLDVGNLTNLQNLDCSNNQLSGTLDVRNLTELTYLRCDNNPYTSFTTRDGYTLTMTPAVNGKVWLTGYNKSSNTVELTAKPDSGYAFQAWTGLPAGAPNSQTTSFTLTGDATVKAAFVGTDATLKSLSLSSGTLTPAFDPATTSYTANVGNSVTNVTITATANDTKANVAGNGTKTLVEGVNTFTVTVTAENGSTASYTVTITREGAAASTDATLKSLFLSSGTLAPAFDQATTSYTANVDNSVSNVTITATANDTKANVAGAGVKTLNVGDNPFTVTVTAEDGTPKSYTITITRAAAATTGGSSGTSRHYIITTLEPPKPDNPVLAVIELPVTVGNGTATGAADDGRTASALAEAGRDAKAKTNGIAVQYDAKTSLTYDGFSIVIQRATLDRLIDAKVKYVTLNTGIVDMTFDLAALIELQKQATGDITLTAVRETGLAGDALSAVGSRPAYRLSVGYTGADGKAATVTSFGAGRVTVGLAYQPAATEQTGSLYLVYSADGKDAEWLYQSSYDKNSGNVIGDLGHFSVYGVGYKTAPAFTDTVNHWAKADIDFVVSRGLFSGTSETTFSPDSTITRGMFVTALGRLAGIDPAGYPSSSRFTDVPATAYYAPFVEWAASKGIVSGTGEGSFSPDAAITREQMALIMRQYADKLGYTLPVAREAVTFTDENQITGNMKDAVRAIQQAGIMSGKGNNRFGPKDAATRAEAAVVLRRFVEVVIDRDTAGGWGQNDAGRWLYYLDGKPVTGWKQIESKWYCFDAAGLMEYGGWKQIGGKWYYFYPDGSMAADTKIDGYEIGRDGARKDKE
ncbi:S-layer homology domain-containing protein, partial [Enterocloster bolteae]|uniref:S-layer homology domain-containing protein n=2 Tax=Enterocloster TaxID=2719313 RepID=UPI001D08552A